MIHESVYELRQQVKRAVGVANGRVEIVNLDLLRSQLIDTLIRDSVAAGQDASRASASRPAPSRSHRHGRMSAISPASI